MILLTQIIIIKWWCSRIFSQTRFMQNSHFPTYHHSDSTI